MRPRLYPKIPESRYLCFYPMDRHRGEDKNWYTLPIEERQRQMEEHGMVGRRYAGKVQQIITGSIGFDDWEWGVDLFSRPAGLQETDLRDALRRGQRGVREVRAVLHWPALSARGAGEVDGS